MRRLAVLTSHPIPYQAPIWKSLASDKGIELRVFFEKKLGLPDDFAPELGKKVDWGIPLLEGYEHSFLRGYGHFWRELRLGRFDALLLHSWNSPLSWFAALCAKMLGMRTMLRAENPLKHELVLPAWKRAIKRAVLNIFFSFIDIFLYVGEGNRRFYKHYGVRGRKMIFAPYGVENERFFKARADLPDKNTLRQKLGLPEAAIQYLVVGKLISKKNPMDVLRAYANMPEAERSLVFVGDGELMPELKKYAAEKALPNVHFAGFRSQAEIAEYYASSDVFILASGRGETWGLVVNEAMCFGLPAIVSDMVGSAEDLVSEENGAVFKMGDIDGLAKEMSQFLSMEKRVSAGARSLEKVKEYDLEKTVQAIEEALA